MVTATRVACNKDGNVGCGKSTGDEGGGQATAMRELAAMMSTTWVMVTCTRLVGNKEEKGKGGKGNDDSNEGGRQQRGQGQQGNSNGYKQVSGRQRRQRGRWRQQ
jgi:hypothetical protein